MHSCQSGQYTAAPLWHHKVLKAKLKRTQRGIAASGSNSDGASADRTQTLITCRKNTEVKSSRRNTGPLKLSLLDLSASSPDFSSWILETKTRCQQPVCANMTPPPPRPYTQPPTNSGKRPPPVHSLLDRRSCSHIAVRRCSSGRSCRLLYCSEVKPQKQHLKIGGQPPETVQVK